MGPQSRPYEDVARSLGVTPSRLSSVLVQAHARLEEKEMNQHLSAPDASPRSRLLNELLHRTPVFLRAAVGIPPSTRSNNGGPAKRLEWCRLALAIVDYRLENGVTDPARAFGREPARPDDTSRVSLEQRIATFETSRGSWRERGLER